MHDVRSGIDFLTSDIKPFDIRVDPSDYLEERFANLTISDNQNPIQLSYLTSPVLGHLAPCGQDFTVESEQSCLHKIPVIGLAKGISA